MLGRSLHTDFNFKFPAYLLKAECSWWMWPVSRGRLFLLLCQRVRVSPPLVIVILKIYEIHHCPLFSPSIHKSIETKTWHWYMLHFMWKICASEYNNLKLIFYRSSHGASQFKRTIYIDEIQIGILDSLSFLGICTWNKHWWRLYPRVSE